jgi:hypothetical protein
VKLSSFEARLNQARCRAGGFGRDLRQVRELWGQSRQEFGVMMGQGLLGELVVERWELGLEPAPQFVRLWVSRQLNYFDLQRRARFQCMKLKLNPNKGSHENQSNGPGL